MRVELDFEGDSSGADKAAGTIDASLKALERTTRDLVRILKEIRLDGSQVTKIVADSKTVEGSISDISDAANRAARNVKDVKYAPGQAAAVVAESAAMAAAVDRVGDKARRSRDELLAMSLISRAVLGGTPTPPGSLLAAAVRGDSFQGYSQGRPNPITGVVSDTRGVEQAMMNARRRVLFDDLAGHFDSRSSGAFGLSGGEARGSGGDSGGGGLGNLIRRIRTNDDGSNRSFGGGGGAGGLFRGILPGGARAGAGPIALGVGLGASVAQPVGLGALGLLAALPTFVVGMGGAVAVLAGSLGGLSKAIGGNRDAFEKLDQQSQAFVQNVRSYEPFFKNLQSLTRQSLLPGLSKALNSALSPTTGGTLQYGATTFGSAVSGVAQQAGSFIGSQQFTQLLRPLIDSGSADFAKMAHAVGLLVEAFMKLGVAGIPIANWLSDSAVKAGQWVNKMLDGAKATGRLTEIMGAAKTALSDIGHLISALAGVLYNLGAALGPVGDQILRLVTDGLNRLSDWLAKNRDQITNFIQTALNVLVTTLKILWDIITTVVGVLIEFFKAVSDLTGGVLGLQTILAAVVSLGLGAWAINAASGMGKLKDALLLMARNPAILALFAGLAALAALKGLAGSPDTWGGTMPGGTTSTADIKGASLKQANEVLALRKKGWSDQQIQQYLLGNSSAIKGMPQFGKRSGGDILMASAFTNANALTIGQGKAGGVMPATTEAGNPSGSLLQGPHHTDGFPGSGRTAVDIAARVGAPVLAPEDGKITRDTGHAPATSGTANINGYSLYYEGASGTNYFMTHMSWVAKPGTYRKGDKIGVIADHTQGGAHLHVDYAPPIQFMGGSSTTPTSNPKGTPPPFDIGNKGDVLPASYQLAIAKASVTKGTADDVKAITAAIAYIKGHIPKDTAEATLAYQEEKTLLDQLASIARKALAGRASPGTRLRARNAGKSILGLIGQAGGSAASLIPGSFTNPNDIVTADPLGVAQKHYAPMLAAWKEQIKDFEATLRDKTISASAVSTITARMAAIKTNVQNALAAIKTAAQQQAQNFLNVWKSYVASFDQAFQDTTSKVLADPQKYPALLPLSAALADLQDQHTQQQLQTALVNAQKQLAQALGGSGDNAGVLQAARDQLGKDALAHAIDVAQSSILGINPMDMTEKIIKDMQAALAASAPDPQTILDAQQAVADAEYNIKVNSLQKQATAEQQAYADARSDLQKHLDAALALWGTYYAKSGMTAKEALAALNKLLKQFGFQPITDPFAGDTGDIPTPPQTTGGGGGSGFGGTNGGPSNTLINPPAPTFSANSLLGFAEGGIVNKPHFLVDAASGRISGIMAEHGKEAIVPMGRSQAPSHGDGDVFVDVHVQDDRLKDLISVEVTRRSDKQNRQTGAGADRRRRELGYASAGYKGR